MKLFTRDGVELHVGVSAYYEGTKGEVVALYQPNIKGERPRVYLKFNDGEVCHYGLDEVMGKRNEVAEGT